jgi:dihydropteroate synthase
MVKEKKPVKRDLPQGHFKKITPQIKRVIDAAYDDHRDWRMDPRAFVLIRINKSKKRIEVGVVDSKTHIIHTQVNGPDARSIYHALARKNVFTYPEHYAYLGRELMKAQIALRMNLNYVQDSPLPLPKLKMDAF